MTWVKGQSGNPAGRPRGSRSRLAEAVIEEVMDDFRKHGAGVVREVRESHPQVYLQIVSRLLPQNVAIEIDARKSITEFSSEELAQMLQKDEKIVSGEVIAHQMPEKGSTRLQNPDTPSE